MNLRPKVLVVWFAAGAFAGAACADDPAPVRPASGTLAELREASTDVAQTMTEHLDKGHDWLYRKLQSLFENVDARFAEPGLAPIVAPLSPLRIGFDSEFLHRRDGVTFNARPDLEASVQLPNLERRFRIFISSTDLQESPGDPALERNPVLAGVRFAPHSHINFDLGARVTVHPSAFAALRWEPGFDFGVDHAYPFAKTYIDSTLGLGVSGGVVLERRSGPWVARSASYADWRRDVAATDWAQNFMFGYARAVIQERSYDRLADGHDLACGAAALLGASGDRLSHPMAYEASLLFKRPLHGGWLYGYVQPVVRWERVGNWHPDTGIRIGFDALFWGLSDLPGKVASYCR